MPAISLVSANAVELHYIFNDDSHTMDALVQHRCEAEFLGILRAIAASFDAEVEIETAPLANGGLRRWFKITAKEEGKKATITTAVIVSLVTAVLITPITASLTRIAELGIEALFEDDETKELEKESCGWK